MLLTGVVVIACSAGFLMGAGANGSVIAGDAPEQIVSTVDRMLAERKKRGLPCDWQTGDDVMHWWMEDGVLPGQMVLEEMEEETL